MFIWCFASFYPDLFQLVNPALLRHRVIHGAVQKLHKELGTLLILLSFLCSCTRGVPLLVLPSSDGTQEIGQILQSCGINSLIRYTLEHVPALHPLNEEMEIFKLF